jgi:hypothetical protein
VDDPSPEAPGPAATGPGDDADAAAPLSLAREYLLAVRTGGDAATPREALAGLPRTALHAGLPDDAARTAFWTNVYNAAVQDALDRDPSLYDARRRFFRRPVVTVAGHDLSPDDVEHGILRASRSSLGLGYLPRLRPDAFECAHRVEDPDPRVHFALNCGAASCPPVAAYDADRLDEEFDLATASYLGSEASYDPASGVVRAPRLMLWYVGDFGGPAGVRAFLRDHGVVPAGASPALRFRGYDWSLDRGAWADR